MRYSKFIIQGYRAIDYMEVPVKTSIMPIIGINESGKTSILKAILALDKSKDSYNRGEHLDHKNRYVIGETDCFIKALIFLDEDDVDDICGALRLRTDNPLIDELKNAFRENKPLTLCRSLKDRRYYVEGIDCNDRENEKLASALCNRLPYILYFDDFSDRVPDVIRFPKAYKDDEFRLSRRSKDIEWQELVEEIFKRSTDGQHSFRQFINMEDRNDQISLLSDVSDTLNTEILAEWQKLRLRGSPLVSEEERASDLQLRMNYEPASDSGDYTIEFRVVDRSSSGRERQFGVQERSKGFQWFFNFFIKLKFNAKYKSHPSGAIYLLDEPGSYLHSSAQAELLRTIKDLSDLNTILYCTHSQYLLDPETINVSSVRIANKVAGKIEMRPFGSAGSPNSAGALSPLYDALHLHAGVFDGQPSYVVITEGITDFYLFRLLQTYTELVPKHLSFLPGAGASKLKELISFAIAWAVDYVVLLDDDRAGRTEFTNYRRFFGEEEAKRFYLYRIPGEKQDVELEDLISDMDTAKLHELTEVDDTKAGIIKLYFLSNDVRKEYVTQLDETTLKNLEHTLDRLKKIKEPNS